MIITITGAKKNVGDYLIGSRGRALLRAYVDEEVIDVNRFQLGKQHLPLLKRADTIVLCGGPAYAYDMYPGLYNEVLGLVDTPLVPMGLGWSGSPIGAPERMTFTDESLSFIERAHQFLPQSSVRDFHTQEILQRYGFQSSMTGCPAWYDLTALDREFSYREVRRLVFTPPALVTPESVSLMRFIARRYPKAEKIASFHRGIFPDALTGRRSGGRYVAAAALARLLGYTVVDASYDLRRIAFYRECDLHIGYRVHAHIYFLSQALASVLINEDGRGQGQAFAIGLPSITQGVDPVVPRVSELLEDFHDTRGADVGKAVDDMHKRFPVMRAFLDSVKESRA